MLGLACTPGSARRLARYQGDWGVLECHVSYPSEIALPKRGSGLITLPSSYTQRVVQPSALQTAISFVTLTALWLAVPREVGFAAYHIVGGASERSLPLVIIPALLATLLTPCRVSCSETLYLYAS